MLLVNIPLYYWFLWPVNVPGIYIPTGLFTSLVLMVT